MTPICIYHLAARADYAPGAEYAPASLSEEGFIHCSCWDQLHGVARRYFAGRDDLVLLEIRLDRLAAPVRFEDTVGSGEEFPHCYGPIPPAAVREVLDVRWNDADEPEFARARPIERNIALRAAEREDLEAIAVMNAMLREDEGAGDSDVPYPSGDPDPSEKAAAQLEFLAARLGEWLRAGERIRVLESGASRVSGYLVVEPREGRPYLRQLFVERGLRRAGIGSQAVELALDDAKKAGATTMDVACLASNRPAERFWRKVGFADRVVMMRRETGGERPGGRTGTGYELISGDTKRASTFILDNLKSFNDTVSPHHRAAREPGAVENLAVMLHDATGRWLGGICGTVAWGWLEVDDLWVGEEHRGAGHGSELVRRLEAEAVRRGAGRSRLFTFSFQARPFYERFGYRVVGTMEDFPPGGAMYWMRKDELGL